MNQKLLQEIVSSQFRADVPQFIPGDSVRVSVKVTEKVRNDFRTRIQAFEGIVIGRRGSGIDEEFTVRRVAHGTAVERTFPMHSPIVAGIEVIRRGDVRRAKLYYLRQRVGKAARVREKARKPKDYVAPVTEATKPEA